MLAQIRVENEQLNRAAPKVFQQLVPPTTNGSSRTVHAVVTVAWKVPIDRVPMEFCLAMKQRSQRLSIDMLIGQWIDAEHREDGGVEVGTDNRLVTDGTRVAVTGPFDN